MTVGFTFVLGLLAFILAVIGGVMSHNSVPFVLLAAAAVCLALIVLIGGRLG